MELPQHIFRAYDIRGIVGHDLTEEVVRRIGFGVACLLRQEGRRCLAIGHDVRASSAPFAHAVAEGVADGGLDVVLVGQCPTPALYYATVALEVDGGIMITGSHNPIEYNGLKICRGVWPIWGDEIQRLREIAVGAVPTGPRGEIRNEEILPRYIESLASRFELRSGLRVAVDCGNGTAGPVIRPLLERLGVQVESLYEEPDGTFPNHLPDPEVPEYTADLCKLVGSTQAHVGFGFDGDSDRVGVIDERGEKRSADHLLLVLARHLLEEAPGGKVIFDVKCSDFLFEDIARRGGLPILWKTGHSIIKEKLREERAILAGELSGHICVAHEYYGFDDAFYAALLLLHILSRSDGSCSNLFSDIPPTHYTPEVKLPVAEESKFAVVRAVVDYFRREVGGDRVNSIDGVRTTYEDGWSLLRASNTTANLTARVEGRTPEALRRIAGLLLESLRGQPVDTAPLEAWIEIS